MRPLSAIRIAILWLVILAPLGTLLILGVPEPYGRAFPHFPKTGSLIAGREGMFDRLGSAVLRRSPATKAAIATRNRINYGVLGHVDVPGAISGKDGWLFFREDFTLGCRKEADVARVLDGVAVMIDMAEAAGLPFYVAIAPDKSTIYPEKLDPRFISYWRCKAEASATLRRLIAAEAPAIIDHAAPILAAKAAGAPQLYFATDTHWTPYGGGLALRQLVRAVLPGEVLPPPRVSGKTGGRVTDMANNMLLLSLTERVDKVASITDALADLHARDPIAPTVVIGDSFYQKISKRLREAFGFRNLVHIRNQIPRIPGAMAKAGRVVVESVERHFVQNMRRAMLSPSAPIKHAIIARNRRRAAGCTGFVTAPTKLPSRTATTGAPDRPRRPRAMIPETADGMPCLRIAPADKERQIVVLLPLKNRAPGERGFRDGHSFSVKVAAGETLTLVLPAYVAGRKIAIGPPEDAPSLAVSTGVLPADAS